MSAARKCIACSVTATNADPSSTHGEVGQGVLVDLDTTRLWKGLSPDGMTLQRKRRTSSLEFTSADLLRNPGAGTVHRLRDDLESFVHVLVYLVLRYRPTSITRSTLRYYFDCIFKKYTIRHGKLYGGLAKGSYLTGMFFEMDELQESLPPPLVTLMSVLIDLFANIYMPPHIKRSISDVTMGESLAKLESVDEFMAIFRRSLGSDGWLEDDGADDQLAPGICSLEDE
ncbi:hypothetical protein OF83DRAFT_874263 [Amylostereum chailletii]|nr:hypothetical protein OF83DRAFT_874263 [Amylostereum chailletii]